MERAASVGLSGELVYRHFLCHVHDYYNRHVYGPKIWDKIQKYPRLARSTTASILDVLPAPVIDGLAGKLGRQGALSQRTSEKIKKLARILKHSDIAAYLDSLSATTNSKHNLVIGGIAPRNPVAERYSDLDDLPIDEQIILADVMSYLPNDILTKVDRASMFHSLETRAPFLSRKVFDFAWSLPMDAKIKNGTGKNILRDVLYRHVPKPLIDRPKSGFSMPIGRWLRSELREWAGDLLSADTIAKSGLLDASAVQSCWAEHLSGRQDHENLLWSVLMFQMWHNRWITG